MRHLLRRPLQVTSVVGNLRRRFQFFSVVADRTNLYWSRMRIRVVGLAVALALGGCNARTNDDAIDDASPPPDDASLDVDGGVPPDSTVDATYRVLHWNIAGGKENDCQTALITAAVVAYVRARDVDLVGLNEVCPAQYDAIRDALRQEWAKGAGATFSAYVGDATPRVVGNAIFSRFNIVDVTTEKVGQDEFGDRNLLCAKIAASPHLRLCSTHLTPGDATARVQLERVVSRLEGWWNDFGDTVILTGDLNLHPNDVGLDAVYAPGANDPANNPNNAGRYRELDDADPAHCRGYGEGTVPGAGGPCQQGGKIDYILARASSIVNGEYSADTLTIPTTCNGACSDHRAVGGQVTLRILPSN